MEILYVNEHLTHLIYDELIVDVVHSLTRRHAVLLGEHIMRLMNNYNEL